MLGVWEIATVLCLQPHNMFDNGCIVLLYVYAFTFSSNMIIYFSKMNKLPKKTKSNNLLVTFSVV